MRYLAPKADLTFKKVFGEHPDLVISFLNALLPFDNPEDMIQGVEYLASEMMPDTPLREDTVLVVRCRDQRGRQFLVEMQMIWSPEFQQRVLFNAAKAYVRQINTGEEYKLLQPVYSLNLVNEIYEPDLPEYYHNYGMAHLEHSDRVIEGLHLIFIELPKFKPTTFTQKKMRVLWLRYLTEINERTKEVAPELMAEPEIHKAVTQLQESAFTEAQMLGYEKFWDIINTEKLLIEGSRAEGKAEGHAEGLAEGRAEGRAEGKAEGEELAKKETARNLKRLGVPVDTISKATGLGTAEIEAL